ncbi:hypothetical protein [Amycolatopsis keratiniphila]|uniref:Uncharacterized protein n=1 Tax=Amycolatopsis keratiniphila subsp. keratiniphila TaxID=227715 RepID=A0A1W2LUS5_9PSEU|nr:hypothetical protein [Amycolatopsis keratiniphila]OLZ51969.1 hypothetical protein BS330_25405 [Amycolatopsis keratiniphila subsp. nogabecina]ONF69742.1 hypothetical protein AVR91_0217735 [Amycolatopsis keratiniphila subsp. keratiniphila]SDU61685.1 hypothetical protein SAMN04489733_7084 [Amycolatopsis keratiniphila]
MTTTRTRADRRRLAVAAVIGHLVVIAGAALLREPTLWFAVGLMGPGLCLCVGTVAVLRKAVGRPGSAAKDLDERELLLRNRAHYAAFQGICVLMLVDLGYGLYAAGQPDPGSLLSAMTAALFVFGTSLPALWLAWRLPDDDPEDFEGVAPA